ncbi:MAG: C40 family peptidase [Rhodococcus sp.]|nr:C40 family peptidase [Rhodococcus sp. (in: high G+C Gram-positive bacteria)]
MASLVSKRSVKRAAVVGVLAAGALSVTAVPAGADPITIPGVGTFELPGVVVPPEVQAFLTPPEGSHAASQSVGERAVEFALSKVGAPYVYGASGPNSFDCSGLVQWAFKQAGLNVPRTSYEQASAGAPVASHDLRPGDVLSFYGGSHSGIYVGDGNFVHASTSGQPVKVAPISSMPYDGARRF